VTALAVDHGDLDVASQSVVLQPVIGDQHIAMRVDAEQAPSRVDPIDADPHRTAARAGKEQWLVAHIGCGRARGDRDGSCTAAAIPAAQDAG